jgi:hypothetical protein
MLEQRIVTRRGAAMAIFGRATALGWLIALISGHAHAQMARDDLECKGPFAKDADEAALVRAFGADNVAREEIDIGEMATEPGAVVFPNDPKRRIEVLWHFTAERRQPRSIIIRGASTWTIAARFPDQRRIAVGTHLGQVEAINGKPFLLNGFGWANGGYAVSWENGAIPRSVPCRLDMLFEPDTKVKGNALKRASGGKKFSSSDPVMRAVKPTVSSISLEWPQ